MENRGIHEIREIEDDDANHGMLEIGSLDVSHIQYILQRRQLNTLSKPGSTVISMRLGEVNDSEVSNRILTLFSFRFCLLLNK